MPHTKPKRPDINEKIALHYSTEKSRKATVTTCVWPQHSARQICQRNYTVAFPTRTVLHKLLLFISEGYLDTFTQPHTTRKMLMMMMIDDWARTLAGTLPATATQMNIIGAHRAHVRCCWLRTGMVPNGDQTWWCTTTPSHNYALSLSRGG